MSKLKLIQTTKMLLASGEYRTEPISSIRTLGPQESNKAQTPLGVGGGLPDLQGEPLRSMRPRTLPQRPPPPPPPPPRQRESAQGRMGHARRPPGPAPRERRSRGGGNLKAPA